MQLLVFDAKATFNFTKDFKYENETYKALGDAYEVFVRFVATQSGLTRWQDIQHPSNNEEKNIDGEPRKEFGDLFPRAINEPWYKGAIFQNDVDKDSLSVTGEHFIGISSINSQFDT